MIRVLVADDEAPARAKLRKLIAAEDGFEVVGEAADGEEAVARIRELAPDLVLLDIQMPRKDGFEVIATIGVEAMPPVIFVTAFDEHALRAFEVHALDYLLKPFAPTRLRKVLDHVRSRLPGVAEEGIGERLRQLLDALKPPSNFLTRLLVSREKEREILLPVEKIDLIRAQGNYLEFFTSEGRFRRRGTLSDLLDRLDSEAFLQVNRSEVVALDAVAELSPWFHGDYRIQLRNGMHVSWSRRYRAKSKHAF